MHDTATPTPVPPTPAPADSTAAPLVDLQPGGVPALINYNVPEPMSFSGRNFIEILLPGEAFVPVQVAPAVQPAALEAAALREPTQAVPTLQVPPSVILASN